MKLIKLYSNYPNFKTMEFRDKGFSFIAGSEKNISNKSTYNGVGKTLSIVLIDFCLGANALEDLKKLECNFYLDVRISNRKFTFSRSTINNKKIYIDDDEYTVDKFKKKIRGNVGN